MFKFFICFGTYTFFTQLNLYIC